MHIEAVVGRVLDTNLLVGVMLHIYSCHNAFAERSKHLLSRCCNSSPSLKRFAANSVDQSTSLLLVGGRFI